MFQFYFIDEFVEKCSVSSERFESNERVIEIIFCMSIVSNELL